MRSNIPTLFRPTCLSTPGPHANKQGKRAARHARSGDTSLGAFSALHAIAPCTVAAVKPVPHVASRTRSIFQVHRRAVQRLRDAGHKAAVNGTHVEQFVCHEVRATKASQTRAKEGPGAQRNSPRHHCSRQLQWLVPHTLRSQRGRTSEPLLWSHLP